MTTSKGVCSAESCCVVCLVLCLHFSIQKNSAVSEAFTETFEVMLMHSQHDEVPCNSYSIPLEAWALINVAHKTLRWNLEGVGSQRESLLRDFPFTGCSEIIIRISSTDWDCTLIEIKINLLTTPRREVGFF